jgi:hypothetical protein
MDCITYLTLVYYTTGMVNLKIVPKVIGSIDINYFNVNGLKLLMDSLKMALSSANMKHFGDK